MEADIDHVTGYIRHEIISVMVDDVLTVLVVVVVSHAHAIMLPHRAVTVHCVL